ncbi:Glycosyl hydrolases family 2, immunoglobulin-like beta-sandwich domain [Verrucomicrobiia bacterium DG1235]|nr:Glycosyl hydrolases family 2, immunoglobulin-like beta-sandwich domain [Verrucomicrobiae bacterium DG1235]
MNRYKLEWKVGYTSDPSILPDKWVNASVPGAVQLDWASAEGWPHFWQDGDVGRYAWMEKVYWVYETTLPRLEELDGKRLFFVSGGVDYRFLVRVGDRTVHGQEGMFRRVELDLTDVAKGGETLEVVVFPIPDSGLGEGRIEASHSVKPAVSYGWDFHPRLVPTGIWRETFLELRSAQHIKELEFDYVVEDDFSVVKLDISVELSCLASGVFEWSLVDSEGEVVDGETVNLDQQSIVDGACEVHDPDLWWPRGYGDQSMYFLAVSLHGENGELLDTKRRRIGFRSCRLVMNEGAWEESPEMPKSRSVAAMTLEVNGKRIFVKGSNWVAPDVFPGVVGEDAYRPLLEKAASCHFNLLRCWGGSAVGKPSFFEQCDRLGLMVWQDFPLACNCYSESPEFLDTLGQEAAAIVKQLKGHPCVVIWCGGNELFNSWSGMTDQSKAIRLLNKKCYELDPDTPFLPTSPIMGVGHGGYLFRDQLGKECFEVFQTARNSAYVEFGIPGPASVEKLRSLIPEDQLFPPRSEGVWRQRHGFGAWECDEGSWLCMDTVERYFGRPESIEELVVWGQLMQAEGLKGLYEEARRQKPYCSMAINWCFNEPWPAAANNSIISWPCEPKPALRAVRQSCRPTLASARVKRFSWKAGDLFEAELWMLHDGPNSVKGDRVEAYLRFGDDESFVLGWYFDALEEGENRVGPVLRFRVPEIEEQTFKLILRVEGRPDWNSEYDFCFLARAN